MKELSEMSRTELAAEIVRLRRWQDAVLDKAVIAWVGSPELNDDPIGLLDAVITRHCEVALNPEVSREAATLRDTALAEGAIDEAHAHALTLEQLRKALDVLHRQN